MEIPEKFPEVIRDFLADLSTTFPEYVFLWEGWQLPGVDLTPLYQYCLTTYPERFFDILYQNDEIFTPESEINTMFLPNVEFKAIYSTPGISDKTKQAIWKYLQLVLITIMGNIKSSSSFGEAAGLFEGIEEDDLQKKLAETIEGLSNFFKGSTEEEGETENGENINLPDMEKAFEEMFSSSGFSGATAEAEAESKRDNTENASAEEGSSMPSADDLHNHIKGLFDGKIGTLAKELAEEMSGDVMNMFDDGSGDVKDTGDVLKKMMRNPKKIMELVKKIGSKLDDKMKSGSISQEELMKEAGDLMSKMKGMGGNNKDLQNMMKTMMKSMGGAAMGAAGGLSGGGKGMFDMNRMTAMMGQSAQKDKMRSKLEQRKASAAAASAAASAAAAAANYTLEATSAPNEFVFKMPDEGVQEKSKAPINDDWLDDEPASTAPKQQKSQKKKGKSGGKKK